MTDLGQYSALHDTRLRDRAYVNKVRAIEEYRELGAKIRKLRQIIGNSFGTGVDTIDEEATLVLFKLKQAKLFKTI